MDKLKYNVGDTVRIIKNTGSSRHNDHIGKIAEITSATYATWSKYHYQLKDIPSNWCEEELEEVTMIYHDKSTEQPQIKTGHLVMTSFDNQWRLAQVDVGHSQDDRSILLNFDGFSYINMGDYKVLKVAEVKYVGDIFRAIKAGTPVEQVKGFKVIYDKTKDEAKDKLKKTIDTLQAQLDAAQDELKEMA